MTEADASSADTRWIRLMAARGPHVISVRVFSSWVVLFTSASVIFSVRRTDWAGVAFSVFFLAGACVLIAQTFRAGVYRRNAVWEFRGLIRRARCHEDEITSFGTIDEWSLRRAIRMLSVDLASGGQIRLPAIAWNNNLNSLDYGPGIAPSESPRQSVQIDVLRRAAGLARSDS